MGKKERKEKKRNGRRKVSVAMETKEPTAEPDMRGWLYKWTNYLKGYQKRWFVLSNGLLSYYRTQAEMAHMCRGTIRLDGASIYCADTCHMVISNVSDGGTHTFHLRTPNEVERQRWVTALELTKSRAIRAMESEEEDGVEEGAMSDNSKADLKTVVGTLTSKLEDLQTCHELISKNATTLHRSLAELEQAGSDDDLPNRIKAVGERATLFRITSTAMIKACSDYRDLVQQHGRRWHRLLQHERDQRTRLEEMVEQLARQHSHLELLEARQMEHTKRLMTTKSENSNTACSISSDDEFEDAPDEFAGVFKVAGPMQPRRSPSNLSQVSEGRTKFPDESDSSNDDDQMIGVITKKNDQRSSEGTSPASCEAPASSTSTSSVRPPASKSSSSPPSPSSSSAPASGVSTGNRLRRVSIPEKPNYPLNLWSIMKNCIGKELSKIPVPVNFSEPLSMLQRLTEDFEYSHLLDRAAACTDSCEQMCYVAAFTVSSYSTTCQRPTKPFNPLLGETYECDRRDDLGWRAISEQVSHHPPTLAQFCEGNGWECYQEFTMSSKFRGKYLQIIPLGVAHLHFHSTGNHYTWRKVTTTVHNIIVGRLWIDQHGDMEIVNHHTGDKCNLKYVPYSYFSRDVLRKVTGCVTDGSGQVRWALMGTWDEKMEFCKVLDSNTVKGKPMIETAVPCTIWTVNSLPERADKMYNFTRLTIELNEPEEGVCPTDCRLRPDQRLMEQTLWDEANAEKLRLEEKQRAVRRVREQEAEEAAANGEEYRSYEPIWFRKQLDPFTNQQLYTYTREYWQCKEEQDWSRCPDIY